MDWTVYWFMLPACILIASIAMLSGISGAAMLSPAIILGFPLLGVPTLAPPAAIGMALFTEVFGFSSGVAGYARRALIDYSMAGQMILVAVPFAAGGAFVSLLLDSLLLKTVYGLLMFLLAGVLLRQSFGRANGQFAKPSAARVGGADSGAPEARHRGDVRVIRAADGTEYRYPPCAPRVGQALTAGGALLTGMISTGIGEVEMPQLIGRCRIPVPVAAGTSILIVAAAVAAGSITHVANLVSAGGLAAVPWNLVAYTVPGALVGGQIGARLQGRISEKLVERFMAGLFVAIGAAFLTTVWGR